MIYKDFHNLKLSSLGMGCMRFPTKDNYGDIDVEKTKEMVAYAFKKGINYFDTAYGYHNGNSEIVMGNILKEYPRDSFYLATKFPGYDINNLKRPEEIFEEQLRKCQVEYFDFYLLHNLCESNIDNYLNEEFGLMEYLLEQKRNGRIRHLGFSTHGTIETTKRFLDVYGKHMEFCQIQLNWLDWKLQNAKGKVELLKEYNLPIWVMEPVRGGKLAKIDEEYEVRLKEARKNSTTVEWAFRFLQSIPEVTMTLSGMSNFDQLKENIQTYESEKPLNEEELNLLFDVSNKMTSKTTLPCTGCRYCTTYCPKGLAIPDLIELYNDHVYSGGSFVSHTVINNLPDNKKPSACIGCRACEKVCPQNIKISEMMKDFVVKLNK